MLSDPGIGKQAAAIGTTEWAQYVRLAMQPIVKDLEKTPERMQGYVDLITEHRAWRLMNKSDGSMFKSLEDFCGAPQPWGLGKPWPEIRSVLEAAHGKRTAQLMMVPEAQPGPGRGHRSEEAKEEKKGNECPSLSERTTKQLRAINRAPDIVKDAYRAGDISQTLAAKLGPKNPKPELAAKVAEIAHEIAGLKGRKQIDSTVRQRLGVKDPSRIEQALRLVERMSAPERVRLWAEIKPLMLEALGAEILGELR